MAGISRRAEMRASRLICRVCDNDKSDAQFMYLCPLCDLTPICAACIEKHLDRCSVQPLDRHDLIALLAKLSVTADMPDPECRHLAADNALLEYVGSDEARKRYLAAKNGTKQREDA